MIGGHRPTKAVFISPFSWAQLATGKTAAHLIHDNVELGENFSGFGAAFRAKLHRVQRIRLEVYKARLFVIRDIYQMASGVLTYKR